MQRNHYATPVEAFKTHCDHCQTCQTNEYGLCATGFRILGEVARMRKHDGQTELPLDLPKEQTEKPFVLSYLRSH